MLPNREKRPLRDPLLLPNKEAPLFVAEGPAFPVTFTKEPWGELAESESLRCMAPSAPSAGPDETACMPCRVRFAMCFCSRVGCVAGPAKEIAGDWGGDMFAPGK